MSNRQIGFITEAQLVRLQRAGAKPDEVVTRLMEEGRARCPDAGAVIIQKAAGGFAIIAVRAA